MISENLHFFVDSPKGISWNSSFSTFSLSETAEDSSENIHSTIYRVKSRVESVFVGYKSLEREFDLENIEFT